MIGISNITKSSVNISWVDLAYLLPFILCFFIFLTIDMYKKFKTSKHSGILICCQIVTCLMTLIFFCLYLTAKSEGVQSPVKQSWLGTISLLFIAVPGLAFYMVKWDKHSKKINRFIVTLMLTSFVSGAGLLGAM